MPQDLTCQEIQSYVDRIIDQEEMTTDEKKEIVAKVIIHAANCRECVNYINQKEPQLPDSSPERGLKALTV